MKSGNLITRDANSGIDVLGSAIALVMTEFNIPNRHRSKREPPEIAALRRRVAKREIDRAIDVHLSYPGYDARAQVERKLVLALQAMRAHSRALGARTPWQRRASVAGASLP